MVIEIINSLRFMLQKWKQDRQQRIFQQRMIDRYGPDWLERLTR